MIARKYFRNNKAKGGGSGHAREKKIRSEKIISGLTDIAQRGTEQRRADQSREDQRRSELNNEVQRGSEKRGSKKGKMRR